MIPMIPTAWIPRPDPIPVSAGWLEFFLLMTFVLHLLVMNTLLGGCLITLAHRLGQGGLRKHALDDPAGKLTTVMAYAVNSGVAPFLFLQVLYGHFFYPSAIFMARYFLSIVGLLLLVYYGLYIYTYRRAADQAINADNGASKTFSGGDILLGMITVGLLLVAFFFSNAFTLMLSPESWGRYFEHPMGTLLNLIDSSLIPRYLHFVTASIAVAGLVLALWARYHSNGIGQSHGTLEILGLRWFTHATVLQIPIGTWFLMRLPQEVRTLFLGGGSVETILLLAGIAAASLSLFFGWRKKITPAGLFTLMTIIFMVVLRDFVRKGTLGNHLSDTPIPVATQYLPCALFLVALAGGLFFIVFMLQLAFQKSKEGGA